MIFDSRQRIDSRVNAEGIRFCECCNYINKNDNQHQFQQDTSSGSAGNNLYEDSAFFNNIISNHSTTSWHPNRMARANLPWETGKPIRLWGHRA